MKKTKSYNIQIWCGLRKGYGDKLHSIEDARQICNEYIDKVKDCVTITPTEFSYVNGEEPGVIIGMISYPRFPKSKKELRKRAFILAQMLMEGLEQFRVTIVTPKKNYMLENKKKNG